ncbi:unnamed protein product [Calicophoron daubneyi]|uniref:DRBM domain-containing protein n=1 Tax=Calicophoron daubneyi TaxID=300641 RepID=A0AAV2TYZ4_CALDB
MVSILSSAPIGPIGSCSPAAVLNQKALKRHLKVIWNLFDEYGSPHDRTFCVRLSIVRDKNNMENYDGVGRTIKLAKQMASKAALERSVYLNSSTSNKTVEDGPNLEHERLYALIKGVPNPAGPRAELQQIARIFNTHIKFTRCDNLICAKKSSLAPHSCSSSTAFSSFNNSTGPEVFPRPPFMPPTVPRLLPSSSSTVMYRIVVHFMGRQYVGESITRSGAEQQACSAALEALRRAISVVHTTTNSLSLSTNAATLPENKSVGCAVRLNSSIWRLRVLAALHFERPSFKVYTNTCPSESGSDAFRCQCTLGAWGEVEVSGKSNTAVRERAAELMLSRVLNKAPAESSDFTKPVQSGSRKIQPNRQKSTRSKAEQQFQEDRAKAAYGRHINPIERLEYVRLAKGLAAPSYEVIVDDLSGSVASSRQVPKFTYQVRVGEHCVQGAPGRNKRLAKRLAAEAALEALGFQRPPSPKLRSALRGPVQLAENHCDSLPNTDSKEVPMSSAPHPEYGGWISPKGDEEPSNTAVQDVGGVVNQEESRKSRISFSCVHDVLVIDEPNPVGSFTGRNWRSSRHGKNGVSLSPSAKSGAIGITNWSPALRSRTRGSSSLQSDNLGNVIGKIGHWSDSQEAKSVGRHLPLRRSRSCFELRPLSDDFTRWTQNRASSPTHLDHTSVDIQGDCTPFAQSNLLLLSRLAVFCLKEHGWACTPENHSGPSCTVLDQNVSDAETLLHQLVSLCQRLRIHCQFVDRPPPSDWNRRSIKRADLDGVLDRFHTVLTIGTSPFRISRADGCASITVHATGRTKNEAHSQAAVAAFRRLAEIAKNPQRTHSDDC